MGVHVPESMGRWVAVLIVVPFLVYLGVQLLTNRRSPKAVAYSLFVFSGIFFVYESLWLLGVLSH